MATMRLPTHFLSDPQQSPVLNMSLNADDSLFGTAETDGYRIWETSTLKLVSKRDVPNGSLRFVLPLYRTNLIFLVGGPPSPLYAPNKVIIWDDRQQKGVGELEFREDVRGLAARRDRLVVVLLKRVILFALGKGPNGIWREGGYDTAENPKGLIAIATAEKATLLAFPGRQPGQVTLVHLPPLRSTKPPPVPPPDHDPTVAPFPSFSILLAHRSSLSALCTNPQGLLLATSSTKGTLIRIWDSASSQLLRELRRGTDEAEIFGLRFRPDGGAISVSSDKGTVHIWELKGKPSANKVANDSSADRPSASPYTLLKPFLPKYFSSEWSHSQFRLPPPAVSPPRPLPFLSSSTNAPIPTIEDDVCICAWIVTASSSEASPSTSAHTQPSKHQSRPSGRPQTPTSNTAKSPRDHRPDAKSELIPGSEMQLVAITRSGGWYRLSIGGAAKNQSATTHVAGLPAVGDGGCRAEEYRRWGLADGWD